MKNRKPKIISKQKTGKLVNYKTDYSVSKKATFTK